MTTTTQEHLDRLARLADEKNWREVVIEGDEDDQYDAMAWSPADCEIDQNGEISDPLFHKPWKLVEESLTAIRAEMARHKVERDELLLVRTDLLEQVAALEKAEKALDVIIRRVALVSPYYEIARGALTRAVGLTPKPPE